jgi:hypothetical protein
LVEADHHNKASDAENKDG